MQKRCKRQRNLYKRGVTRAFACYNPSMGSHVIVAGLAVSFTNHRKCDYHCLTVTFCSNGTAVQLQGTRAARSRSEILFSAFILKFSTRSDSRHSWRNALPFPHLVSTVTFGYIRIKKGGITQGGPRCHVSTVGAPQSRCMSYSLSASSQRKLYLPIVRKRSWTQEWL